MISWTRLVLGQTQEDAVDPDAALADEVIVVSPTETDAALSSPQLRRAGAPARSGVNRRRFLTRVFALGLIAVAIAAIVFLVIAQWQRAQQLEQQLALAQAQIGRLQQQNQELSEQFSGVRAERSALDERVFSLSVQLASMAADLQRANERLASTQALVQKLGWGREAREAQLARVTSERNTAQRDAESLKQSEAGLTRSVAHLRQRLALLDRDYRALSAQLVTPPPAAMIAPPAVHPAAAPERPAPPRAVSPNFTGETKAGVELSPVRIETAPPSLLHARLVTANQQQRFVIIDHGSQNGVREGMVFDILQRGAAVGRATAVRLRPKLAACNLVMADGAGAIMPGDLAVQRNYQ